MSTLHKVKAYFGMAPMEDYDDEYYDDHAPARGGYPRQRFAEDGYSRYEGRDYEDPRGESGDYGSSSYRGGYPDEPRFRGHEYDRGDLARPRFGSLRGSTRGALAMDPRRMAMLFDESSPLSKITTLRPKDYSEARTIGYAGRIRTRLDCRPGCPTTSKSRSNMVRPVCVSVPRYWVSDRYRHRQ